MLGANITLTSTLLNHDVVTTEIQLLLVGPQNKYRNALGANLGKLSDLYLKISIGSCMVPIENRTLWLNTSNNHMLTHVTSQFLKLT